MKRALIALGVALVVASVGVAAVVNAPSAPTNLEQTGATETSVTIAWGPSQPGAFLPAQPVKKNGLLVAWGASEDSRSAVTYTLTKDGTTVASGLTQPSYTVTVPPKVKSFRACATAQNARGQSSPTTCATYTRP